MALVARVAGERLLGRFGCLAEVVALTIASRLAPVAGLRMELPLSRLEMEALDRDSTLFVSSDGVEAFVLSSLELLGDHASLKRPGDRNPEA